MSWHMSPRYGLGSLGQYLQEIAKIKIQEQFWVRLISQTSLLWMCRAMFPQSALQFGFLITVETLSFSPEISTGIRVTPCKTQIYWFAGFPADI